MISFGLGSDICMNSRSCQNKKRKTQREVLRKTIPIENKQLRTDNCVKNY